MVCLHGTDPATIHLSARVRVAGMTVDDLERAMYFDRSRSSISRCAARCSSFLETSSASPRRAPAIAWPRWSGASSYETSRRQDCTAMVTVGCPGLPSRFWQRWPTAAGHVVGVARRDRLARGLDHLRRREVVERAGSDGSASADRIVRSRAHRAGVEQRRMDHLPAPLGLHGVLSGRGDCASTRSRGRGGTGRAVAARVRPRHGRRPQVVARVDGFTRSQGPGEPPRGRS